MLPLFPLLSWGDQSPLTTCLHFAMIYSVFLFGISGSFSQALKPQIALPLDSCQSSPFWIIARYCSLTSQAINRLFIYLVKSETWHSQDSEHPILQIFYTHFLGTVHVLSLQWPNVFIELHIKIIIRPARIQVLYFLIRQLGIDSNICSIRNKSSNASAPLNCHLFSRSTCTLKLKPS